MATYEGRLDAQGAKAPCRGGSRGGVAVLGGLGLASERPRVRLEYRSDRSFVRGYDFGAPPLEVLVMVPFDVGYRRGEGALVGERSPVELLRPEVVARGEVAAFDEGARAVPLDFPNTFAEFFFRRRGHDEVDVVGEDVGGQYRDMVLPTRLDYRRRDELLVVGAEYDRFAHLDVKGGHSGGNPGVMRYESYEPPLHNPNSDT